MVTHVGIWLKFINKRNIVEGITRDKMKHVYLFIYFHFYNDA